MLKKRPVLAGAVALAMGLTFLSGCGGDTVPTGDNGDTSGSTGSTTTTANAVSEIPGVAKTYQLAAKVNGTAVKTMVLQEPSFDEQSGGSLGLSGPFFLTGSGTIPEGLSSTICQAFQGGNEKEILSSMMDDTEITREEFFRRVGDTWLEEAGWSAQDSVPQLLAVCVDGDNDGVEDIACEIFSEGSAGFSTFHFFKGMGEGTYSHTHVFDSILEEFGFLSYEEKHYLCRTNFDYDTKLIDGVDIFLYTDGVLADAIGIRNQIVEYQKETVWLEDQTPAPQLEDLMGGIRFDQLPAELSRREWKPIGTAERRMGEEQIFCADLDADGREEQYSKEMQYSSSLRTVMAGAVLSQDGSISVLDSIRQTIEESAGGDPGIFYTFWADKNGEDTVIFCYYARGFDYTLYLLL